MSLTVSTLPAAWERPVFIITTGRSGSTLLLRYVNCAKGVAVWGEHAGILNELNRAFGRLTCASTREFVDEARPWVDYVMQNRAVVCPTDQMTVEWVNSFDSGTVRQAFRHFIAGLFTHGLSPNVRWGFKEIHYASGEINLLRALFAAPRFLLLVRNPLAILRSKYKAFAKSDVSAMPPHVDETLCFLDCVAAEIAAGAADVLLVHYETLTRAPDAELARIGRFIDAPFIDDEIRAITGERAGRDTMPSDIAGDLVSWAGEIGLAVDPEKLARIAGRYRELVAAASAPEMSGVITAAA